MIRHNVQQLERHVCSFIQYARLIQTTLRLRQPERAIFIHKSTRWNIRTKPSTSLCPPRISQHCPAIPGTMALFLAVVLNMAQLKEGVDTILSQFKARIFDTCWVTFDTQVQKSATTIACTYYQHNTESPPLTQAQCRPPTSSVAIYIAYAGMRASHLALAGSSLLTRSSTQ